MEVNIEQMRAEMRWEARKFGVSAVLVAAASVGAGVAIGNYFARPSGPQVVFQPGSIVVQPSPAATK